MTDWQAPLPTWKLMVLVAMTLTVVFAAHWHSAVAARREVAARDLPTRRQRWLSYLVRHQLHYMRQVPLMVFFVLSSVIVVADL